MGTPTHSKLFVIQVRHRVVDQARVASGRLAQDSDAGIVSIVNPKSSHSSVDRIER